MPLSAALHCLAGWPRWTIGLAIGCAGAALRALLSPWIGAEVPFLFAFPAAALGASVGGVTAGVVAALVSALWLLLLLQPASPQHAVWLQVLIFLPAALLVIWAASRTGRAEPGDKLAGTTADEGAADAPAPDAARWLKFAMAASAVVPTAVFGVAAWQSHRQALADAEIRLERAARVAQEQALKVFETNALLVDRVHEVLGSDDAAFAADGATGRLQALVNEIPQVHGVVVRDATGRALVGSMPQARTEPMVRPSTAILATLQEGEGPAQFSEPIFARSSGELIFLQWAARPSASGRFTGVVSIGLRAAYFSDFYREVPLSQDGMHVALWLDDGTILARAPEPPRPGLRAPANGAMMRRVLAGETSGMAWATSVVDGSRRYSAFRKVGAYPVYVSAGLNRDEILAGWQSFVSLLAAITFPMAAGLVLLCWTGWQRATREAATLRRLEAETRRRAHVEEALRQAQKLETLGHLTGGVAHDVNNLLMVVHSSGHVLRRLLPPEPRLHRPLDAIARAVETGSRLTRQLLAFSRRQALRPEVVRLQDLFPGLLELLRHPLNPGIRLEGEIAEDTAPVKLDTAELELALLNLTVNARDAMPGGGLLRIAVRNARVEELDGLQGEFVLVSVRDTGHGIAPEVLQRVFEPFFTTKEPGRGTGLGLSQVWGFCAQAGGRAQVLSTPGQGTTVQMLLAASREPLPDSPTKEAPAAEQHGRVLLVEDNEAVAAATQALLESFGYHVRHAPGAGQAAALLAGPSPGFDVVLSDILMPADPAEADPVPAHAGGLALARHVRERHPALPVVLMTGYTSELDRAVAEGFTVLHKPCAPRALAEALARAIGDRQARADPARDTAVRQGAGTPTPGIQAN